MNRAIIAVTIALALAPIGGQAHSDGPGCDGLAEGAVAAVLDTEPVSDVVHCHQGAAYGYDTAVYVQLADVAYAGVCVDTALPLPEGYRIRPVAGAGVFDADEAAAQGCSPA